AAHRARHGRDDAARGTPRARPHGGGIEPRPNVDSPVRQGRHRPGQHRAQGGSGRAPPVARRRARVRFERGELCRRFARSDRGDGRDTRVRCHRRGPGGGGGTGGQIVNGMEAVLLREVKGYSRYGSPVHKQVYLYGSLDPAPTEIARTFGMSWGVGGWLVFPFLQRVGAKRTEELKQRVAAELTTTFATSYARTVSLAGALQLDVVGEYGKRSTGAKVLVAPNAAR